MSEGSVPAHRGTRWLTSDELATWRALNQLLSRLPAALGEQLQRDSDLSFLEYYVLAGLADQSDRRIRMSRLAVLANSELSRLSHLIARLELRGFVVREPDPTDRRSTNAVLTETGQAYLTRAAPAHVDTVRNLVFDTLDTKSQHALRHAAQQILTRINDAEC